jgi:NAD(P)-dependent dehydrogenase (short-subunit alcohol dehydrogenase family)
MIDMSGKVLFVTGAGKGLGKAIANKFGSAGASVFIADIDSECGEATSAELRDLGMRAKFCKLDLCNESDIERAVHNCVGEFGGLDVLVNSARPQLKLQAFPDSMSEWDMAMQVLLKAPALTIAAALPELARSGKGSVINISSTNAYQISHQPSSYHVAKSAILQLTRQLAYELGPKGIRVNAICPGIIEPVLKREADIGHSSLKKLVTETVVPLGRAGFVNEITDLVLFLGSEMSTYINGESITIDGGMTIGCSYHSAMQALNAQ